MKTIKQLFPKVPTLYTCTQVQNIIDKYINHGGQVEEIEPGCLGYGLTICHGDGLKTCIIREQYLNEWSSGHTMRFYNKTPAKYKTMIQGA